MGQFQRAWGDFNSWCAYGLVKWKSFVLTVFVFPQHVFLGPLMRSPGCRSELSYVLLVWLSPVAPLLFQFICVSEKSTQLAQRLKT